MSYEKIKAWSSTKGTMEHALTRLTEQELADLMSLLILEMQNRGMVGMEFELSSDELRERVREREAKEKRETGGTH